MDERLRLVARLLRGREDGAAVRRVRHLPEDRLQDLRPVQRLGGTAFTDRSRRPHRQANGGDDADRHCIEVDVARLQPLDWLCVSPVDG